MPRVLTCQLCLAVVSLAFVGCSQSGPQLGEVTGTVTLDGKAVPNAEVHFNPTVPGGSYSTGKTNAQGKYRLGFTQDRYGAMLGKHNVEIRTKKIAPEDMPDDGSAANHVYVELPKKYNVPGALSAEVKSGRNTVDFELTSN